MSTQDIQNAQDVIVGGWTAYHKLTDEDRSVFKEAISGEHGNVKYEPQLVSTQVVAGVNYRYKCTASAPPALVVWEAVVQIFKPLHGKPYVTDINRI
jgi:hypothetical protein